MLSMQDLLANAWQRIANSGNDGVRFYVYVNADSRVMCLKEAPNHRAYSARHNAVLVGVYTAAVTPKQLTDDVKFVLSTIKADTANTENAGYEH